MRTLRSALLSVLFFALLTGTNLLVGQTPDAFDSQTPVVARYYDDCTDRLDACMHHVGNWVLCMFEHERCGARPR